MATLYEAQAFVEHFDKCLPLCERGDAVTVINALHTLNNITQASISQVKELQPADGRDFFCSFLLELELALELYISPMRKLGTIDGGLPALYSVSDEDLAMLSDLPSVATKIKVKRFLQALGVSPSAEFESRGISKLVKDFLRSQVQKDTPAYGANAKCRAALPLGHTNSANSGAIRSISVSWADQCSSSESDLEDMPPLEDGDDDAMISGPQPIQLSPRHSTTSYSSVEEESYEEEQEEEEALEDDGIYLSRDQAAYTFLFSQPVHRHNAEADEHDAPLGLCKPALEEGYGMHGKSRSIAKTDSFYKTRLCKNWEQNGSCQYGSRCNFAHGEEELRPANTANQVWASAPTARPATRRQPETTEETDRMYKTRMCNNFELTGHCKFGDKCNFAHGKDELRRCGPGPSSTPHSQGKAGFKKKLCERFLSGTCPYGPKCNFAHGADDLK